MGECDNLIRRCETLSNHIDESIECLEHTKKSTRQRNSVHESKEPILKTITENQAQTHLGDVIRKVVEDGDPIIVERAGTPQVAVISLADLERLCGPTALDNANQTIDNTPNMTKANLWDEFERELRDLSIE